jgi:hypothetical protein
MYRMRCLGKQTTFQSQNLDVNYILEGVGVDTRVMLIFVLKEYIVTVNKARVSTGEM